MRWDKKVVPFKRGSWLRLYGIPLHAWNDNFFKLSVMECGTCLRTDTTSLDRERFDYACVLIAKPSLDVVNMVDNILIDDVMMEVKIVEEWGFNMGEDACLFEDGEGSHFQSDNEDVLVDLDVCNNVGNLVNKIVEDLEDKELNGMHQSANAEHGVIPETIASPVVVEHISKDPVEEDAKSEDSHNACICATPKSAIDDIKIVQTDRGRILELVIQPEEALSLNVNKSIVVQDVAAEPNILDSRRVPLASSPPGMGKVVVSGPWSVEWLQDQRHGDAGIIFSPKKNLKKKVITKGTTGPVEGECAKRKKVGGTLRHSVHSLKKVARLPSKDRSAIMHALKKRVQKRQGSARNHWMVEVASQANSNEDSSSCSVNNFWKHWVVLRGNEKVEVEDVGGIGKAIGVKFDGETHNMFSVLYKAGKGKRETKNKSDGKEGSTAGGWM